jgi:hypothetical protein
MDILNKNNKYITKTSSNFVNQGINSSQISYTKCARKIDKKTIAEPTPSYAGNAI